MKKKIIVISLIIFSVLIGGKFIYHATMSNDKKAEKMTNKLEKELLLNSEQKSKVYALNLQVLQKREIAKKEDNEKTCEENKSIIMKEWLSEMKLILSNKQLEKVSKKLNSIL